MDRSSGEDNTDGVNIFYLHVLEMSPLQRFSLSSSVRPLACAVSSLSSSTAKHRWVGVILLEHAANHSYKWALLTKRLTKTIARRGYRWARRPCWWTHRLSFESSRLSPRQQMSILTSMYKCKRTLTKHLSITWFPNFKCIIMIQLLIPIHTEKR